MDAQELLLQAIHRAAGVTADVVAAPGTTVLSTEDRRGSGMAVFYQFDRHTMIWCDPAAEPAVAKLEGSEPFREPAVRSFAADGGFEILGASVMKTMGNFVRHPVPDGYSLHRFDWNDPADIGRMQRLVDASTADDLDESEVAMDDLDAIAVGLINSAGEVAAFASMRPFDYEPSLGDIGVIVRDGNRGKGLGSVVVAQLVEHALPNDWHALYRCDPYENPGSDRLSTRVGFLPATDLLAIRAVASDT